MMSIIQVGDVLLSIDIIKEYFCCNLDACHGACCIEGDAGAPVEMSEVAQIENATEVAWNQLSAQAQSVIDKQGVVYNDCDGDLVTSIVNNKDCVFTCYQNNTCLCALERVYRQGKTRFCKPISCSLYPIREKRFANNLIGLNYHRWDICKDAVKKGRELKLPIYKFLKEPLIKRFGQQWYEELEEVAKQLE